MFGCCYPCFFSHPTTPRPPDNVPLETIASTSAPNSALSPLINPNLNVGDDRNRHVVNHMPRQQAYPEHAVAVILHGLGGIGKTTLANAIFARIEIKGFKVSKVRLFEDIGLKPEITKLQTLLLQDLKLGPNELVPEIRRFEDGQQALRIILEKQQAFLYIDNALSNEALEKLLPMNLDKCKKLRLLLTARSTNIKSVLTSCRIKKCHTYHVTYVASAEAMEIFKRSMNDDPGGIDRTQIQKIVEICGGIPLVLKVVGGYIGASKDKEKAVRKVFEWRENGKLFSIEKEYKVLESDGLFFAYDELPEEAKDPFLEICLFFNGWDWDTVECIVGEDELDSLQKRSLVENKSNRAIIHDVLLAIGRKRTKGSRFTSANDLRKVLRQKDIKAIQAIKGIWLQQDNELQLLHISAAHLDEMHNSLRVLALGDMTIVEGQCKSKFQQLIYFQAGKIANIPFDITRQEELRFLNCRPDGKNINLLNLSKASHINSPSQSRFLRRVILLQMPSKLKQIELHKDLNFTWPSFEITSEAVMKLQDLMALKLDGFDGLKNLPEEIRYLSRLKELDLTGCECAQLPQSLGDLNALQKLTLEGCQSVKELPQSLVKLRSLKCLELQFCESLTNLPAEIGSLSSLEMLDLSSCTSLKELPSSFCNLSSLQYLKLTRCINLLELSHGFGNLKVLAVLKLDKCANLRCIPDSFGELTFLQALINMNHCKKLTQLSEGFCNLTLIEDLSLAHCYALERLPQQFQKLVNLRRLNLECCKSLSRLPIGFGNLKALAVLNLWGCERLEELCRDLHCLTSLRTLDLRDCPMLEGKWMERVTKIKTLNFVDIKGSQMLAQRWAEIENAIGYSHLAVRTGKDSEKSESIINKLASRFLSDEWLLRTCEGEPFYPSAIQSNTVLLVIFDTRDAYYPSDLKNWNIMEKIVADEIQINSKYFKIIYIGKYLSRLPTNIARRVTAYASYNSDAHMFFDSVLSIFKGSDFVRCDNECYFIGTEVDEDGGGSKQFFKLTDSWEELIFSKSETYLRIKYLLESPQDSNMKLLKALLESPEDTSFPLMKSNKEKVNIYTLQGKLVLLFIISSPEHYYGYGVTWLIIRNPWLLKSAAFNFFRKDCNYVMGYGPILLVVDREGRICNKNALPMVERWGEEAYPFNSSIIPKLVAAEWGQLDHMSSLEFLFRTLCCLPKVKEGMLRGEYICLFTGKGETPGELIMTCSKLREVGKNVQIKIIYCGDSVEETDRWQTMDGISLLNLSSDDRKKLWRRVIDLNSEIEGMGDAEKLARLKTLLHFLRDSHPVFISDLCPLFMVTVDGEALDIKDVEAKA
eukprot:Gb_22492 [translate_table: standard]